MFRGHEMPVIPPKEDEGPLVATSVRLPQRLLQDLDEIAETERYSRNEVITFLLRWARDEWRKEQREKKPPKKS